MDYISRDAARAIIEEQQKSVCYTGRWGRGGAIDVEKYDALEAVLDAIGAIPTADVAPVRHGHWVPNYEYEDFIDADCSVCGKRSDFMFKYCPFCGTRMDGGADNA